MNHPAHDKLIAIAKGWQMHWMTDDSVWHPVSGDFALKKLTALKTAYRIRIAPGQPEVAEDLDGARYRYLRDNPWPDDVADVVALHQNALWDKTIDQYITPTHAAVAGKESGNE